MKSENAYIRYVVFLSNLPGKRVGEAEIRVHVQFLQDLDTKLLLELCGPFRDGLGGMIILKNIESLELAQQIAAADPFVAKGYKAAEVRVMDLSCEENNHLGMG